MSKIAFVGSLGAESWLYTTDGSLENTITIKKVSDYHSYTSPAITAIGAGKAVFQAISSTDRTDTFPSRNDKYDIWFTDGTSEGTYDFSKIFPSLNVKFESLLSLGNGKFVFGNNDGVHGYEPWVTDGTISGTHLIKDLNPGAGDGYSDVPNFMAYLGKGKAIIGGLVTDGTQQGTFSLGIPGGTYSDLGNVRSLSEGKVFFTTNNYGLFNTTLWTTDGTKEGTHEYMTLPNGEMTALYYAVRVADGQIEFDTTGGGVRKTYLTDGTVAGTHVIQSGPTNSSAPYGKGANLGDGRVIFAQSDSEHGKELWIANHDMSAPKLLADLQSGQYGSDPTNFTAMGDGRVMFYSSAGTTGAEPWVTDGTPEGTYALDIVKGFSGVSPLGFADLSVPVIKTPVNISINDSYSDLISSPNSLNFKISLDHAFSSGALTVRIPVQQIGKSNEEQAYSSANSFDVPTPKNGSLSVTFNPGEVEKNIIIQIDRSKLVDPDKLLPVKIAIVSDTTDTKAAISKDTAIGFIQSGKDLTSVSVLFDNGFDKQIQSIIKSDIAAAVQRISDAVDGHLPHLEIRVISGGLDGDDAAGALPITSWFHKGFDVRATPVALVEQLSGHDPNGSDADIEMHLQPDVGDRWYSGNGSNLSVLESTHYFAHEIMHGLGFSQNTPFGVVSTPWNIFTDSGSFVGKSAGSVPLTDDGHLADANDLMGEKPFEGRQVISLKDAAILNDLGFSASQPSWAAGYTQITGTGKLVHGYVSGATIFSDTNGNGFLDIDEASSITDAMGNFILPPSGDSLVATGGTDVTTGLAIKATLKAPAGSAIVSPLTTLISDLGVASEARVLSALGLPVSMDLATLDPVAAAKAGDPSAYLAAVKIYGVAVLIGAVGGGMAADGFTAVETLLSNTIGPVNLGDPGTIATLLASRPGLDAATTTKLATAIAGTISAIDAAAQGKTGDALITAASAVERVAEGVMTSALAAAGTDATQLVSVANAYTGQALTDAITLAQGQLPGSAGSTPGTGTGPSTGTGGGSTPSAGGSTVDLITPTLVLTNDTGVSSADHITKDASIAVTTATGTLSYKVDDKTYASSYDPSGLFDGQHTVKVFSTDAAGNHSAEASLSFTLDLTAPKPILSGVSGQTNHEAGHTLSGDLGTSDAGLTVTVCDDSTVLGTTTADSAGHFSFAVSDTKDGPTNSYALTASATDAAGNVGTSDSFVFNIDYSANRELFGTLAHDTASHLGQVYALYEGLLGRAPDQAGAQYWVDTLDHGTSLKDVTQAILTSGEGQSHLNAVGSAGYVEQLYGNVLDRVSDASGKQAWVTALDQGTSRAEIADSFVFSGEHLGQLKGTYDAGVYLADPTDAAVARLYHGLLDRAPDAAGLTAWEAVAHTGAALPSIAQSFLTSTEYVTGHSSQTDTQFVDSLYAIGLGRPADAGGEQGWLGQLAHGVSRADVAVGILQSQEAQAHFAGQIEQGWHLT